MPRTDPAPAQIHVSTVLDIDHNEPEPISTRGSGNVFADIGLPDPDGEAIKARLVMRLRAEMDRRKLSQTKTAEIIGAKQSDVSNLVRGRVSGFSLSRMLDFMEALGHDVEITVRSSNTQRRGRRSLKVA